MSATGDLAAAVASYHLAAVSTGTVVRVWRLEDASPAWVTVEPAWVSGAGRVWQWEQGGQVHTHPLDDVEGAAAAVAAGFGAHRRVA